MSMDEAFLAKGTFTERQIARVCRYEAEIKRMDEHGTRRRATIEKLKNPELLAQRRKM